MDKKTWIQSGKAVLGIEFGSTRIKAVLIDGEHMPIASGSHQWENRLEDGIWTYSLEDIWKGLQDCYRDLAEDVRKQYGVELTRAAAIGISAMMHGYMVFDSEDNLLVSFRTWRNTITGQAAEELSRLLQFNIPERWSIAHLYQAVLKGEPHVPSITYMTTLAGYIHWKLTGRKVLGVGDASGMFPIDSGAGTFDAEMLEKTEQAIAGQGDYGWRLGDILPRVLSAGQEAGVLTEEGAALLDPSGRLQAGIPLCPPEGDAGTGMAATNSVAVHTGNVSAGTSVFAMVVLDKALNRPHREIDMVTTPDGKPVAMVHVNNCTSDFNAWAGLFREFAGCVGVEMDDNELFSMLYRKALEGDADCGGLLSYGYLSGEPITGMTEGRPLFVRLPDGNFTLANVMRTHLYSALGALKIGMDILTKEEHVTLEKLLGHGGFFKTPGVGQRIMAAAMNTAVSVMETAGEGGPWGMALLAAYMVSVSGNGGDGEGKSLPEYLNSQVFAGASGSCMEPDAEDAAGFEAFLARYRACLPAERAAVENLR